MKLLLVHFMRYWEEEESCTKLQELSSEELGDMSCTDESCSVPSKEQ